MSVIKKFTTCPAGTPRNPKIGLVSGLPKATKPNTTAITRKMEQPKAVMHPQIIFLPDFCVGTPGLAGATGATPGLAAGTVVVVVGAGAGAGAGAATTGATTGVGCGAGAGCCCGCAGVSINNELQNAV